MMNSSSHSFLNDHSNRSDKRDANQRKGNRKLGGKDRRYDSGLSSQPSKEQSSRRSTAGQDTTQDHTPNGGSNKLQAGPFGPATKKRFEDGDDDDDNDDHNDKHDDDSNGNLHTNKESLE